MELTNLLKKDFRIERSRIENSGFHFNSILFVTAVLNSARAIVSSYFNPRRRNF